VGAAASAVHTEFSTVFFAQVKDDQPGRPRSITVWRLNSDSADQGVSRAALRGCSARSCAADGIARPAGAFRLDLAAASGGRDPESRDSYYFLPLEHQSAEDLVSFFNECGSAPLGIGDFSSAGAAPRTPERSPRQSRSRPFEVPSPVRDDLSGQHAVRKAQVLSVEEHSAATGRKVMVYTLRCNPKATASAAAAAAAAGPWEISKVFADFAALQHALVVADKKARARAIRQLPVLDCAFSDRLGVRYTHTSLRRLIGLL
jgi:hypothetical protein